ncbi:MAG: OmpA family protein [Myxococcaceae bacterium]|nr:OmpA family protein [Myxococcaceae bacterium]
MNARRSTWGLLACLALGSSDLVLLNSVWWPAAFAQKAPEPVFQPSRPVTAAPVVTAAVAVTPLVAPAEPAREPVVLHFQTSSFALTAEQNGELERVAQLLLQNPLLRVRITGHADRRGVEARNVVLSEYRARAVASALRSRRVPAEQMGIEAHGSAEPLSQGTGAQALALDRRAELHLVWGSR